MSEAVRFLASFPPIQSAIKTSGNGDGMRITLDIPQSEMAQAVKLIALTQVVLEVTIKVAKNEKKPRTDAAEWSEAKQRDG